MAKISLWLDTRKESKSGLYPVVLRITNKGTSAHVNTHISISPDCWSGSAIVGRENKRLNDRVQWMLLDARLRLSDECAKNPSLAASSAKTIKDIMYAHERALDAKETANNLVSEYYEIFLRRKNSEKTKEQYEYMKFKVSKFCDWETLTFEEIDVRWLKDWHASMERIGNSPNTCADVEINLRALFNSAIEDKVIKEDCYPFKVFKIRKADTKKRSLTLSQLRQLMECDKEPHQHRYWDCFMLSLYLCGINMVDLLHLPRQESLDRIGYLRSKTGIWVEFDIPQDARVLLEKYAGKKYLVNFAEGCKDYESFVDRMNMELKRIGKVIKTERKTKTGKRIRTRYEPIVPKLSSYWARHTYATIAFDCDMPEQIIDMSMAHKSPFPMTDIYIARNMRKINKYLPKICDVINGRMTLEELEELG